MADDPEILEIKELVKENHKMLRGLQVRARIGSAISITKWVVIIAITLGVYTFISPFFDQILGTYSSIQESAATIKEIKEKVPAVPQIPQNVLDIFKQQ